MVEKDKEMIRLVYVQFFEAFDFLKRLLSDEKQISLPVSSILAYWEELAAKNLRNPFNLREISFVGRNHFQVLTLRETIIFIRLMLK